MDTITSNPTNPLISTSTPVFSDNVQDLLGTGTLQVHPTSIITVNSTADAIEDPNSGVTTLRDAINQANADQGEDLIVFDRSLFSTAQTITLNLGELDITHSLDIIAPRDSLTGGNLVTVSGNQASRVFEIGTGASVNIDGLIVADGKVTGDNGGGILNSGILTLDNSIVSNDSAIYSAINYVIGAGGNGGGIYNSGTISLSNSTISGNHGMNLVALMSSLVANGGGIYNSGTISLSNSTISGNSASSGGTGNGGGISNTGTATLSNSTISGNSASGFYTGNGGGISNTGTATLSNSTISGNSAGAMNSGNGGGIFNSGNAGNLTLSNSTISGNKTSGSYHTSNSGAGIYNSSTLEVSNSTISDNSCAPDPSDFGNGGGISNSGNLTLSNSTISGNNASYGYGGGILNYGTATLSNSTISGNTATQGGGICSFSGSVTLSNSTISGNKAIATSIAGNVPQGNGGGIYNEYSSTLTVSNSTISGNSASGEVYDTLNSASGAKFGLVGSRGGGIYNSSTLTVSNSTISGNSASGSMFDLVSSSGGGIYNGYSSTLTLVFSTVTQNVAADGGGLFNSTASSSASSGTANVRNTIIASNINSANGVNPDVSGTFTSNGYNLIGDSTGSTGFDETIGDIVGNSNNPIDPRLDTLAFNGGPTQTIALLSDSPAIGAADPIILDTDPITDQRGLPRRAADGSADIGAYELS